VLSSAGAAVDHAAVTPDKRGGVGASAAKTPVKLHKVHSLEEFVESVVSTALGCQMTEMSASNVACLIYVG
jgi:hypothetical protein